MAASIRPSVIDKFSDIDFQSEVEIICNFLRWDTFPRSSTENFKRILEKRAQSFCVEEYIPTDDASPALPWQLFYTGSPESTGDEQVEDLLEAEKPPSGAQGQQDGDGGCKRLVIPHPRQQLNILSKVHEGKGGVHHSSEEMWEKMMPVYYWRHIGTSIIDVIKNCETCKLHPPDPGTSTPSKLDDDSSRAIELQMEDDDDDSFESFQLSNEIPYSEEINQIYDYLKTREYPANSTPNFKRGLRRKSHQYMLADKSTDGTTDATDIVSSRKLYFLKARERRTLSNAVMGGQEGKDWCKRLVVPLEEDQHKILQVAHIGASGAHCGRNKMLDSIGELYYWKGMYQSIMSYLESCSRCRSKHESRRIQKISMEPPAAKKAVKRTPKKVTPKHGKGEGIVTRSATKVYNTLACQKENFTRRTIETFNYLKHRSYPPDSTPDAKRDIRRRSHGYTIGQSEAEEWPEIYGHSDPEERLYYLKKFRKLADQEDDDEDVDDHRRQEERSCRRLVVTTEKEQNVAIMKVHVDEKGIHNTRTSTLNRLTEQYFWLDMKASVNEYINDCTCTLASHGRIVNRFPTIPQKVSPVPPPEKETEPPPLPLELTDLPKGMSRIAHMNTEVEALVVYLYLKWQRYPPECSDGFKRMVRKKASTFLVQEEEGGEDGENTWCLYYKGDLNSRESKGAGKVVEAEETAGDGARSVESAEEGEMEEPGEKEEAMETAESKETKETQETAEAMQTPHIIKKEVTVETAPAVTKKPSSLLTRKEKRLLDYPVRNRLFVFRKPDQVKILHHVHLYRGKRGEHAGRDTMLSILGRHVFWRGLRDDVMVTIMKCKRCQLRKNVHVGSGLDYAQYIQEFHNGNIQNEMEDSFEDQSPREMTPLVQSYLENAMRLEDKWDAEELAARQGTAADLHYNGSMTGGDAAMDVLEGDRSNVESRVPDGDSSIVYHQCDSCPRRFGDRDLLRRHKLAEHSGRASIPCSVCGRLFKSVRDLEIHTRSHTKEKPFECEYCQKRFGYRGGLTRHRKAHFGLKPFACQECPQRFITRSDLNHHFKSSHEGSGDYQCDVCEKSFVTPVRLDMHKKRHLESRQSFVCEICGKVLASAFSLKFHMHIHTGERHILCELCGKGFKKKDELAKHMRRHLGIKPHQCQLCQQQFCLKGDLQDHLRSHEGASLYQCEVCDKKFKNRRSMGRCKRRHNAEPAHEEGFQCNTCGDVLGTLVDFTQHMEAHVGEQMQEQHLEITVGP